MERMGGLAVPVLGLWSCLCSGEHCNSTEVDRRASFTFILFPSSMQEEAGPQW